MTSERFPNCGLSNLLVDNLLWLFELQYLGDMPANDFTLAIWILGDKYSIGLFGCGN
jgi:hypothetical protein